MHEEKCFDEYTVKKFPTLRQLLRMAEPDTDPRDQFFVYFVKTPCSSKVPRIARLTECTEVAPQQYRIEFITELVDDAKRRGLGQVYMEGFFDVKFKRSGKMAEATITLNHDTCIKQRHERFAKRPELVTIGA